MAKMQIVVPFYKVPKKLITRAGWKIFKRGGKVMGMWDPKFGSIRHVAVVEAEVDEFGKIKKIEKYLFDQMERADGPLLTPEDHATPNAMVVVVEEDNNHRLMVHSVEEWRPFIYDQDKKIKGVKVTGITGKWSKKIGENPAKTALDGLASDMGIEVEESTLVKLGKQTSNRAWCETCLEVYVAKFKRKVGRQKDETHDIVELDGVYPIGEFPMGVDALVNSALWMVARHFKCNLVDSKMK
jgi:hypothetical protein